MCVHNLTSDDTLEASRDPQMNAIILPGIIIYMQQYKIIRLYQCTSHVLYVDDDPYPFHTDHDESYEEDTDDENELVVLDPSHVSHYLHNYVLHSNTIV